MNELMGKLWASAVKALNVAKQLISDGIGHDRIGDPGDANAFHPSQSKNLEESATLPDERASCQKIEQPCPTRSAILPDESAILPGERATCRTREQAAGRASNLPDERAARRASNLPDERASFQTSGQPAGRASNLLDD